MNLFLAKLRSYYPLLILLFVEVILFFITYIPGTYLVGWDNLYPEFNLSENLYRNLFSLWQENRGLGVTDGLSFAANLPHTLFIGLLSLLFPQNILRYVFLFLMHFLGGTGMYVLIRSKIKDQRSKLIALLPSLFYQFNITTIQMFYAPFEVFVVHFAFLPWLLWSAERFLESKKKGDLLLFAILSFVSLPQAHVPSVFLVYGFALMIFCLFNLWRGIRGVVAILLVTFAINAYWGLPYLYSAIHSAPQIANSKINLMVTDDIFLQNNAFADFWHVSRLIGFIVDYKDAHPLNPDTFMMAAWRGYMDSPLFILLSVVFLGITLLGMYVVLKKGDKHFYPFMGIFLFAFLMLATNIPVVNIPSQILHSVIPLFHQVFRYTFTKFGILFTFCYSLFFGLGLMYIVNRISRIQFAHIIISILSIFFLFLYSLPAWQGYFFFPQLQRSIPQDYVDVISFFKNQPKNERIGLLPQPSFWGWTYTSWGYRGSGFMWFGIPQATMDGAFYPWSRQNENYYAELSRAVYSKNLTSFEQIFEKYHLSWLLIDESGISPFSEKADYVNEVEEMMNVSQKFSLAMISPAMRVYKIHLQNQPKDFVFTLHNPIRVEPSYVWGNNDIAYEEQGPYVSNTSANTKIYYPFRSLFTGRRQDELEFHIEEREETYILETKLPPQLVDGTLILPMYPSSVQIFLDGELLVGQTIPLSYINHGTLTVIVPKQHTLYHYDTVETNSLFGGNISGCEQGDIQTGKSEVLSEGSDRFLRLTSSASRHCGISIYMPNLSNAGSYVVTVRDRYQEGRPLLFWLENLEAHKSDIETLLTKKTDWHNEYFIQPPMDKEAIGYSIHSDNISVGGIQTVNDISRVAVYPFPYDFLTQLKIIKTEDQTLTSEPPQFSTDEIEVSHPNTGFYTISLPVNTKQTTLGLSQSFDSGWKAYQVQNSIQALFPFLFGHELKKHVLVNNWANGWQLENLDFSIQNSESRIVIIYLSQYLEYLGFALLIGLGVYFLPLWRR